MCISQSHISLLFHSGSVTLVFQNWGIASPPFNVFAVILHSLNTRIMDLLECLFGECLCQFVWSSWKKSQNNLCKMWKRLRVLTCWSALTCQKRSNKQCFIWQIYFDMWYLEDITYLQIQIVQVNSLKCKFGAALKELFAMFTTTEHVVNTDCCFVFVQMQLIAVEWWKMEVESKWAQFILGLDKLLHFITAQNMYLNKLVWAIWMRRGECES